MARLEETTWGIALQEIEGERLVVPPAGALADPPWTVGTRPGREAVERVKELYRPINGHVTHLGQEYRTLAETLRGRWIPIAPAWARAGLMVRAADGSRHPANPSREIPDGPRTSDTRPSEPRSAAIAGAEASEFAASVVGGHPGGGPTTRDLAGGGVRKSRDVSGHRVLSRLGCRFPICSHTGFYQFTDRAHVEAHRHSFRGAGRRSSGCSTAS